MNLFNKTLNEIKYRKESLEKGIVNSIPYPFPDLNKIFPGIVPETQQMLTTVSGIGKSKFTRKVYVKTPFDYWVNNHNEKEIDLKVFYFSLEDSKERVLKYMIIAELFKKYGVRLNPMKLDSYFENDILDNQTLGKIESLNPYFENFFSKVDIIDNIRTPNGIFSYIKKYLLDPRIGHYSLMNGEKIDGHKVKEYIDNKIEIKYQSTHLNRFVIVIIDNLQNIEPDKEDFNKYQALDRFTRSILRNKLCNFYKTCNVFIQQQAASKEAQQYTNTGNAIIEKLYPSIDGLGEFKNSVHTAHVCYGLFSPARYNIEHISIGGKQFYDITKLGDKYRSLTILKSNFIESNIELSLFFDGLTENWFQLPNPNNKIEIENIYQLVANNLNENLIFA